MRHKVRILRGAEMGENELIEHCRTKIARDHDMDALDVIVESFDRLPPSQSNLGDAVSVKWHTNEPEPVELCMGCAYFNSGFCYRFPPVPVGMNHSASPVVEVDGWCGEFKADIGPINTAPAPKE